MNLIQEASTESPFFRKWGGIILIIIGTIMAFLSGFEFYTLEVPSIPEMLIGSGTLLLGIGNVTDIWKGKINNGNNMTTTTTTSSSSNDSVVTEKIK
jgi:membrane-bound ClpP family serine protease